MEDLTAELTRFRKYPTLEAFMEAKSDPKYKPFKAPRYVTPKPKKLVGKQKNDLYRLHEMRVHWDNRTFDSSERHHMTLEMFMTKKAGWKK